MKKFAALLMVVILLYPIPAGAQDLNIELEDVEEDLISLRTGVPRFARCHGHRWTRS